MADDEFAQRAAQLAVATVEDKLIQASRDYQDAQRSGDEATAAEALRLYAEAKRDHDLLTGAQQQQQASGQLSVAQRNFLSRRAALGDQIDTRRLQDYARGHERAVAAGLKTDSPEYFSAVSHYVDHLGDGKIPPLDEREAAKMCEIDEQTYANNAARLRHLRATGQRD